MGQANRQEPRSGRSRLVIRVLVTLVFGTITFLAGILVNQSGGQSFLLSVFVGGVAFVVQQLAEFEASVTALRHGQDRVTTELQDLVERTFSGVSEATKLYGKVEATALRAEVDQLAHSALGIGAPATLVVDLIKAQLRQVNHLISQIGGGSEVTYDGEDRDWLLALTHHAKSSLDATSRGTTAPDGSFVDEGLWLNELGQRYLEAQGRALRNGVVIRRVFILDEACLVDDPVFREIYERQRDMGIQVRTVTLSKLRSVGITFVSDAILFDDAVSYEMRSSQSRIRPGQPMYIGTTLILDRARIDQQRQRFDELWAASAELARPELARPELARPESS